MTTRLHHINIVSNQPSEVADFYSDILGLESADEIQAQTYGELYPYRATNRFVTDGSVQLHLAQPDRYLLSRVNKSVNPMHAGPMGIKTTLDERGIPNADYGVWAMEGWHQIFFHDPVGDVVDVRELIDDQCT
jgi:catechol 2,3-dioxygenase-like lactoylglutathione lyase family enzyme